MTYVEHITCLIETYKNVSFRVHVVAIYRPSPSKQNQLCASSFHQDLEIYATSSRQCVIVGKVNFDLDILQESKCKKFLSALDRYGILDQFFKDVTH